MTQISIDKKINAFTIVELMVSITISVLLLGWIFYFMSDTILWISRSSSQTNFLKNFSNFTTILERWNPEVFLDYAEEWFDVVLLKFPNKNGWILIGVIDRKTLSLSPISKGNIYHDSVLWYRNISSDEIINIQADNNIIYSYDFSPGDLFDTFNLRNFQLNTYNSWSLLEMKLDIFPQYNPNFTGENWNTLPQDEIFTYSLIY